MIQIPENIYEQHLTDWFSCISHSEEISEEDKSAALFFLHLSKAQMVERHRGDEYPFIEAIKLTPDDFDLIKRYHLTESKNIEIKAYCLDICIRLKKDKREIMRQASDAYLELYKRTKTPWYLARSVVVRFFQKGSDQTYVDEIAGISPHIHGTWLIYVSEKLAKDCKDNLDGYVTALESQIKALKDKHNWHDAVATLDALNALNIMSRERYHFRRALLYEEEFDYRVATQTETTYNMKLDSIKDALKEISKIKDKFPEVHNRIRNKMITEQKVFTEKIHLFGVKIDDRIPDDVVMIIKSYLKGTPIKNPVQLITTIRTIPFPSQSAIKSICRALVKRSPLLYMSSSTSLVIGDKGQIIGKADTEESLKITAHKMLRNRVRYVNDCLLYDFFKQKQSFDEDALGQALCDACNVSYIEESRKVLWAKGIVDGCKDDMISAAHILMPQIERALVVKAQQYCGDLTNYEKETHNQISLEKALDVLKAQLKGPLYDELRFFLNHGADVNFRNQIAHGLMNPELIKREGVYLWWLAIKMFFCGKEIFKKT